MPGDKKKRSGSHYVDEWLDDQSTEGGTRHSSRSLTSKKARAKKNALQARSALLDPTEGNASVTEVFPKLCRVLVDGTGTELLCPYRRASVYQSSDEHRERSPVVVGDRVKVTVMGSRDGVVEGLCTRGNVLMRPAPGRGGHESKMIHAIVANIELLVIVSSVEKPAFNLGIVDRYLIAAQVAGIPAALIVNKIDLNAGGDFLTHAPPWSVYRSLGISVFEVSAKQNVGLDALAAHLHGRRVAFCGHSGVGKTSLLRVLLGRNVGQVAKVSEGNKKGTHTTKGAVLFQGPGGAHWVDTPGVREFGLVGISHEHAAQYFPEFRDLPCTRAGCDHITRADCQATGLARYESFKRIFLSLRDGEA
ncbi:MAG: ribosome small subunit-dependent GTPase A [Bacteriovoracia bacterium]